jgi:dienelactone hydrolase
VTAGAVPSREVSIPVGRVLLPGTLTLPASPRGIVLFAHGSGSSRSSPRNRLVAGALAGAGIATLLFDLLTPAEDRTYANRFDIALLTERLAGATAWLDTEPALAALPLGYFGASTGAAAALDAAAAAGSRVRAVVSRGGRPDLASSLARMSAATLLIVGGEDREVIQLNREARARMRCACELAIVPGATHLFEEPGALEAVAVAARDWFLRHL